MTSHCRGRGRGGSEYGNRRGSSRTSRYDTESESSSGDTYSPVGSASEVHSSRVEPLAALESFLRRMDGANYGQLKQLTGRRFRLTPDSVPESAGVSLQFCRIQPDPFAPGSQISVTLPAPFHTPRLLHFPGACPPSPQTSPSTAKQFSPEDVAWRRVAAEDFLLRCVLRGLSERHVSTAFQMLQPSQHVLPRSTVQLIETAEASASASSENYRGHPSGTIRVFLRMKLPGHGRRIDGSGAHHLLFAQLLPVFQQNVLGCSQSKLWAHVTCVHDQEWLRGQLHAHCLVAFIADGAVLPRSTGDADTPLRGPMAVPFQSPPSLKKTFRLPYSNRTITGCGLPKGLTLIAGGGFHGKSTLSRALELGIYNHVPDDGRTFVVVDATAVKIRAEDRRAVHGVDISPFITHLPFRDDTTAFATTDASGSTSQAANIIEALELGAGALLLDEDTCATNLMYRDAMMEQLVPKTQEPITSFVHRVRDLIDHHGVSVVMVAGGSGQYFSVADVVLVMTAYHVQDATRHAKEMVLQCHAHHHGVEKCKANAWRRMENMASPTTAFHLPPQRHLDGASTFDSLGSGHAYGRRGRGLKVSGVGQDRIRMGEEEIQLSLVEQLVEEGQLNAIAQCLAMVYDEGSAGVEELQRTYRATASTGTPPLVNLAALRPKGVHTSNRATAVAATAAAATVPKLMACSDFGRLVLNCEARLRLARLELQTPSCYLPLGFTALPRVFEIGAAFNRLRTLVTLRK